MSAAAAGSNDIAVNSIAQELVCSGKINSRLKILIGRLMEINYFEEMQHYFKLYFKIIPELLGSPAILHNC